MRIQWYITTNKMMWLGVKMEDTHKTAFVLGNYDDKP